MILSIFIRDTEFHISTEDKCEIYRIPEKHMMVDKIPYHLQEFISKINIETINTILYPSCLCSFTTSRIIDSIIKGLQISIHNLKLVMIIEFMPYINIIKEYKPSGCLATRTARNSYIICKYNKDSITCVSEYNCILGDIIFCEDKVFAESNFATEQIKAYRNCSVEFSPFIYNNGASANLLPPLAYAYKNIEH